MKNLYLCLFLIGILLFSPPPAQAQEEVEIVTEPSTQEVQDTTKFTPNPTKAVIYSAIFPGLGQIYNRKYWKLPIVYGGFLGCVYAITWNGSMYNGYKDAFRDFTDGKNETNSWIDYNYKYYGGSADQPEQWNQSAANGFSNMLKTRKDFYRRNRDLSIFAAVGVYALAMIDAYVDAQLFEFDISDDLSMRVSPTIFERNIASGSNGFGLQCSMTF